jgi:hypothetical protein
MKEFDQIYFSMWGAYNNNVLIEEQYTGGEI